MTYLQGSSRQGTGSEPELDMRQPAPFLHTGIWFIFYSAGMLLEVWSAGVVHKPRSTSSSHLVTICLIDFAASFVVFFYIWFGLRRNRFPLADLIGFRWRPWRDNLLVIEVVAGNWIGVSALYTLFGAFSLRPSRLFSNPQGIAENVAVAFVLGAAGFFEEIEFRGYLLRQALSITGSKSFAIAVQAFFFSVAHGLDQTLVGFFAKFAFGWVLGEIAVRRRSLLPGMVAHTTNNLVAFALLAFAG